MPIYVNDELMRNRATSNAANLEVFGVFNFSIEFFLCVVGSDKYSECGIDKSVRPAIRIPSDYFFSFGSSNSHLTHLSLS